MPVKPQFAGDPLARYAAGQPLQIAIDTEFKGAHTLTIQAAARVGSRRLAVQIYRSESIPRRPQGFDKDAYLPITPEAYGRYCDRIEIRKTATITSDLSPVRLLKDLYRLPDITGIPMGEGRYLVSGGLPNGKQSPRTGSLQVPRITVVLIGHFLPADFGRVFGREFYDGIFRSGPDDRRPLAFRDTKMVGLAYAGGSAFFGPPVVEYAACPDGSIYEICLETRDTTLPFGKGSLDKLSQSFLGLSKSLALSEADKRDMLNAFRDRTADAYGYAMVDAVNTLLIYERMKSQSAAIFRSFGVPEDEIPPMKPTCGSRVASFLFVMTRPVAANSGVLSKDRGLKALMKKGGIETFGGDRHASRFGHQTGQVHGGLNYSRSPTRFWHESPGMLGDVDMSSCYNSVIGDMDVYWGRPVVFEPGNRPMTLRQAVEYLQKNTDPDAWYVRVTGDLNFGDNVLIPSTLDAVTSQNYRKKKAPDPDSARSRLFSRRIESGVVTRATWLAIGAMPPALRAEYEGLNAESLVFYPKKLAARDGAEFDPLVADVGLEQLPWESVLDLEIGKKTVTEPIDADYVSLRFPVKDLARKITEQRKEARSRSGKGSAEELAWKLQGNTMFGVLASSRHPTGNAVAANQITAAARARAWALILALNGIQVVTDGSTFRLDQIPACTLAECLELQPDYPLRRAEAGGRIPFLDPASIPDDDAAFTRWYRDHVRHFLGVEGPDYDQFFGLHELEFKQTGGDASFDALACDGSGCYLKCRRDDEEGEWEVVDQAMRGHGPSSQDALKPWLLETYSNDRLETLPPLTLNKDLLKVKEARQKARGLLNSGVSEVVLPLGYENTKVSAYQSLRLSAFVCQTPKQFKALDRQFHRFAQVKGCGLEILALRRGYRGKTHGSLAKIAETIYGEIRSGKRDLSKALHPNRESPSIEALSIARLEQKEQLARKASSRLKSRIDATRLDPDQLLAAIVCTATDQQPLV